MKISKQNISVGIVSLLIGIFLGVGVFGYVHSCPEVPVMDNHLVDSLLIENAIKEGKIIIRDSIIKANDKQQFVHDSIIINNHKDLKKDYDEIKNLTPDLRAARIDSVLKRAGVRRR